MLCSLCLKATKHHSENRIAKCVRLFCMLAVLLFSSCSVMSDSLWHHGLQHTRLPCPSPSLRLCLNSCPLSWWCHSAISSSVIPFCCLQSFPASGSFPMSQLFPSGGQSIGVSALILPMNIQDWFPLGLIGLVLQSKGLSRVQFKSINYLALSLLSGPTLRSIHNYWKNHSFGYMDLCWQSDASAFQYTV